MDSQQEIALRQAQIAAQKAVEHLEAGATGLARMELLNALTALEKI